MRIAQAAHQVGISPTYLETARKTRVDPRAEGSQRAAAVYRPRYPSDPGALLSSSARPGKACAGR